MKQKGLALIVVVLLTVVAIGGYLVYSGKISINKSTPQQTTLPLPTSADETANWKTYTSDELAFLVKYPPNWSVELRQWNGIYGKEILSSKFVSLNPDEYVVRAGIKTPFYDILIQEYKNPNKLLTGTPYNMTRFCKFC